MGNKNLRRLSLVVTAQTAWHLEQLARVCGYRETGHVVDKLVREKMLSIRQPFARQFQQAPAVDIATPVPLEELRSVATEARTEMNKWVSVQERLPTEHDSIFKKLIHTDRSKWNNDMFLSESDYVIVSVTFRDGTRKTGYAHTKDGMWVGLPMIGGPVVTHWMPMPEPPKGDK